MEVILMQDVAKLGRRYDIVKVPNGRALNLLIPRGLALPATPENKKRINAQRERVMAERAETEAAFKAAMKKLDGDVLTLNTKANEKGHLFEAIKEEAIVAALTAKGIEVSPTQIIIAEPIKTVGTHKVELRNGDDRIDLTLEVVA